MVFRARLSGAEITSSLALKGYALIKLIVAEEDAAQMLDVAKRLDEEQPLGNGHDQEIWENVCLKMVCTPSNGNFNGNLMKMDSRVHYFQTKPHFLCHLRHLETQHGDSMVI